MVEAEAELQDRERRNCDGQFKLAMLRRRMASLNGPNKQLEPSKRGR